MQRSKQLMIQLAAIVPLMAGSESLAVGRDRLVLHTNQGDVVSHSNQESRWYEIVIEPQPMALPSTLRDPFAMDVLDPWSHGNSPAMPSMPRPSMPRMTTPQVRSIPAPATLVLLGLAGLLPARRRRTV